MAGHGGRGGADGEEERLTEELLERLLASATPEAYLDEAPVAAADLAGYAQELLAERGLRKSEAIRASGLNEVHAYDVFRGKRGLGRDNAIRLAFGLRCTLREAQRLLRHAGVAELWCKLRRDAIIIYCLEHGLSCVECDDELYRLGERTLASAD